MDEPIVQFPPGEDGRRSTTAVGRRVVAAALGAVDPEAAAAAEREPHWRSKYVQHFRRLVEVGTTNPQAWHAVAAAGLEAVNRELTVRAPSGEEIPLAGGLTRCSGAPLRRTEYRGHGTGRPELVLPYRGDRLRGDAIRRRLDDWAGRGVIEPSVVTAVTQVLTQPELLRLEGHTVAVLGAGSEIGPLPPLLGWGATVAAVELPDPARSQALRQVADASPGLLLAPVRSDAAGPAAGGTGADLLRDPAGVADWLAELPGRLTIGNYTYADGAVHVLLAATVDAIGQHVRATRPDLALAFLATPADVFVVPHEVVEHARRAYDHRSTPGRLFGPLLRIASGGRLLEPAYRDAADPALVDALAPVQGPNYALAKRIQRWRACLDAADGPTVSMHVAPSSRTRSVLHSRMLSAVYAGASHFGIEIFAADTARTLMAALLVHDLQFGVPRSGQPWLDEVNGAVHGGVWRAPYTPRSGLRLAGAVGLLLPH
jgi:hypothetical protein